MDIFFFSICIFGSGQISRKEMICSILCAYGLDTMLNIINVDFMCFGNVNVCYVYDLLQTLDNFFLA